MTTLRFTPDQLLILRDALSEETVRMRQHIRKDEHNGSERATRRLTELEIMLAEVKAITFKAR